MPTKDLIRILSIDGGGIRGIIPALVLAEIERLSKRPACELFDLIAGTSTGGIIALGVTVPSDAEQLASGQPRWSAQDLAGLYVSEGPKIFARSLLRTIQTADSLIEEKYAATGLEAALERYMGDVQLSHALTDVLVTSYDIQTHEPVFFKSFVPRPQTEPGSRDLYRTPSSPQSPPSPQPDYPMRVVARATSAAPTYFEPEHVLATGPGESPSDCALVDGGTFANNPAMCAYAEALRNHPGTDVLIVSLGTGRLTESISFEQAKSWGIVQWLRPLLGVMMDGSSAAIDYQLDMLLGADVGHFRFQSVLEGVSDDMDDASTANIEGLRALAEASIERDAARLAHVCARLTAAAPG